MLTRSGSMLYIVFGRQKWSGKKNQCGVDLLPVLLFMRHPACQHGRVPELYPSFRPMQRVYLSGRKLRCWACSLEPKPYRCSITPQTVSPICTPIIGEVASLLGRLGVLA